MGPDVNTHPLERSIRSEQVGARPSVSGMHMFTPVDPLQRNACTHNKRLARLCTQLGLAHLNTQTWALHAWMHNRGPGAPQCGASNQLCTPLPAESAKHARGKQVSGCGWGALVWRQAWWVDNATMHIRRRLRASHERGADGCGEVGPALPRQLPVLLAEAGAAVACKEGADALHAQVCAAILSGA